MLECGGGGGGVTLLGGADQHGRPLEACVVRALLPPAAGSVLLVALVLHK
jgi:hypothetical protein